MTPEQAMQRVLREGEQMRRDWERLHSRYPAAAEAEQHRALELLLGAVMPREPK